MRKNRVSPENATTAELLAQELHRQYRAGEKALRCTDVVGERPYLQHDHGWEGCHKQKYFRRRALLMLARSLNSNARTLGEIEQSRDAVILILHSL